MKNVRFLVHIIAMGNAMGGYAPSDRGVMPGEERQGFFSGVEENTAITSVDVTEGGLRQMTDAVLHLSAAKQQELAAMLSSEPGEVASKIFIPQQEQSPEYVMVDRKNEENYREVRKLRENGEELRRGMHTHLQTLGHAFTLSDQDRIAFAQLEQQGCNQQVLSYVTDFGIMYRAYHITGGKSVETTMRVGSQISDVCMTDHDGKTHFWSGQDALDAISIAEQGGNPTEELPSTVRGAKIVSMEHEKYAYAMAA